MKRTLALSAVLVLILAGMLRRGRERNADIPGYNERKAAAAPWRELERVDSV